MLKDCYSYTKYPDWKPVEKKCSTCRNASNKCTRICNKCFDNVSQIHENWEPKGETMKYKIIGAISAKTLLDKDPCDSGYRDYVFKFGTKELVSSDFIDFISWAEEHGHIDWLFYNGFIEVVEEKTTCIWCGGECRIGQNTHTGKRWVLCMTPECEASGPVCKSAKEAIDGWNECR